MQAPMQTFDKFLQGKVNDEDLAGVLVTLSKAVKQISNQIRTAKTCAAGTENVYGEQQLALDVLSDQLIQDECRQNERIGLLASEELPDELRIGDGEFAVAYDPLDGSSLVDVNLAVGSIFGVYRGQTFIGVKGDDQLSSMIAVYGPRTTIVLAVAGGEGAAGAEDTGVAATAGASAVNEFTLVDGEFCLSKEGIKVGEGKMFAPGNLRACAERQDYLELTNFWMKAGYTLRYSGGMVPDVNQILLKGKGIFSYPPHSKYPEGKLRLLFECAPMAFLMEKAGGAATDGKVRILEKPLVKLDQRTPIYIGSREEVKRCEDYLGNL